VTDRHMKSMTVVLNYQHGPRENAKRRRRIALWAALSFIFIFVTIWKGRNIREAVVLQYQQWQCLRFEKPDSAVAYDSDHQRMMSVAVRDRAYVDLGYGYGYKPSALRFFALSNLLSNTPSIIFMHERVSPGGHRRLVVVEAPTDVDFQFRRFPLIPAAWFGSLKPITFSNAAEEINFGYNLLKDDSQELRGRDLPDAKRDRDRHLKTPLRIFFGQPDHKDASHFTINYEVGAEPGVIDGWLRDDDAVILQAHGPWAVPAGTYISRVTGKDMMMP
jgi:hypothetical protein